LSNCRAEPKNHRQDQGIFKIGGNVDGGGGDSDENSDKEAARKTKNGFEKGGQLASTGLGFRFAGRT